MRQAGFDQIQQEQMVMKLAQQVGTIRRTDVIELCKIGPYQASRLLDRLVKAALLERHGQRRGTYYKLRKAII